ncbi:MAG: glucosyltransferase I RfaG [Gammaproteobacteria bacterium RIFCSPHIGHO2_12_FULL_37_14]|nr:MAG: glucosyltransferase I RfaG [Gammaproteobacteria bacterium RIFCSPHIGHO2_12_FULL_37_14]
MKLAFCLFRYFPFGGLERDFLRIAHACKNRGHEIHVYTMRWEGEPEPDFHLHFIAVDTKQNHKRCHLFAEKLEQQLKIHAYDVVIGFNKLPSLDIYYAADVCYLARIQQKSHFFYKLLPRYRQFAALEKKVFAYGQQTQILVISPLQQAAYTQYYQTELERFHLLPPGIAKDRLAPSNAKHIRQSVRDIYQLSANNKLLLMIGSGFKTKGLDRSIIGIASLPKELKQHCQLFVIGQDSPQRFQQLAKRLGIDDQIHFLGGRTDVAKFLLAADLLLHPAYYENTGTVLLEALVSGLPVLTVDICGYAHYVRDAQAGVVLSSPFQQDEFNAALQKMLLSDSSLFQQNGLSFAKHADIYHLPEKAANLIEKVGKNRESISRKSY